MRPLYFKELCELLLVAAPLCVLAVVGAHSAYSNGAVIQMAAGGLILGLVHGLVAHRRRDDLFLLHRPVRAWKQPLASAAAALTICLLVTTTYVVAYGRVSSEEIGLRTVFVDGRPVTVTSRRFPALQPDQAGFLFAVPCALWSLAWLALGSRRLVLGVGVGIVVAAAAVGIVLQMETIATALAALVVGTVICGGLRITRFAEGGA